MNAVTAISRVVLAAAVMVGLAACASPGPREREQLRLEAFEQAAGAPVESFRFWQIQGWEALGPYALAVWTRMDEAWLLRVESPCSGLDFATEVGVTSNLNRVTRRFDAVTFGNQRCRIDEIRPVDTRLISRRAG